MTAGIKGKREVCVYRGLGHRRQRRAKSEGFNSN